MVSRIFRSSASLFSARWAARCVSPSSRRLSSFAASRPAFTPTAATTSASTADPTLSPAALHLHNARLGRQGSEYILSKQDVDSYHAKGYIALPAVLSEEELHSIERTYNKFMNREIPVAGKDFCDMSGGFDRKFEDWGIINAMLPRVYYPPLKDNLYERRAASITAQLFNSKDFGIDYDQLLAKKPTKNEAVFAWHVDLAYWPETPDTRTATFSLAIDPTTRANGCLRFVDGSHLEPEIRPHRPVAEDREKAHAIMCAVNERTKDNPGGELVSYVEVGRGDVTVHNERVVHGSGGNYTNGWRRTYVLAFRHNDTIAMERKAGFTHSHNDSVNVRPSTAVHAAAIVAARIHGRVPYLALT